MRPSLCIVVKSGQLFYISIKANSSLPVVCQRNYLELHFCYTFLSAIYGALKSVVLAAECRVYAVACLKSYKSASPILCFHRTLLTYLFIV